MVEITPAGMSTCSIRPNGGPCWPAGRRQKPRTRSEAPANARTRRGRGLRRCAGLLALSGAGTGSKRPPGAGPERKSGPPRCRPGQTGRLPARSRSRRARAADGPRSRAAARAISPAFLPGRNGAAQAAVAVAQPPDHPAYGPTRDPRSCVLHPASRQRPMRSPAT